LVAILYAPIEMDPNRDNVKEDELKKQGSINARGFSLEESLEA